MSRKSPALILIEHVRDEQGHQMGRSRERFSAGVRAAVRLAIKYGLRFEIGDFEKITHTEGYHGPPYTPDEYDYAIACGKERGRFNPSACLAFESWKKRKPFIIRQPDNASGQRIAVGMAFEWYGERVTCTSFNDEKGILTACTYKPGEHVENGLKVGTLISVENWKRRRIAEISEDGLKITLEPKLLGYEDFESGMKIERRLKITHDDIREYHASLKFLPDVVAKVQSLRSSDRFPEIQSWFAGRFGKRRAESLSFAELQEVMTKIEELLSPVAAGGV